MKGLFDGESVLVTGAAGRLGRIVAAAFQEAGAGVVGADSDPQKALVSPCHSCDLTRESDVTALFERLADDGLLPRVVVHTVGMWDGQPFTETSLSDWSKVIDINLTTTFLVFREALRARSSVGITDTLRLIAFASGQGADRGRSEQAAYSAGKAGVIRLMEAIAEEHAEDNVTAHAIAPSMILFEGMEDDKGIPAADLANLCLLLAGPAGDALSGAVVRAYGSLTR